MTRDERDERGEIEQALAEEFDAEHLSVYGDYLQSIGDPRGELIALDLNEVDAPDRRDALAREWLGDGAGELLEVATIEHGFVADLYLDGGDERTARWLDDVLAGPGGPYLRGVTLRGSGAWARAAVARLAARPHAWLQRLSIQTIDGTSTPAIDGALASALARATPRLQQLEVCGHAVFGELSHDALRSLCVTGYDAVGTLFGGGVAALPELAVLDLAFHVEDDAVAPGRRALAALLQPERLPKLRRLDLSRNEPGTTAPHYLGGRADPFGFLAGCALRGQLTHVRMPSVRTPDQAESIAVTMAGMPALRELAVVRHYRWSYVSLPPRVIAPLAWPWLPADLIEPEAVVRFARLRGRTGDDGPHLTLPLPPLVCWLEDRFTDLPRGAQGAWLELFETVRLHGPSGSTLFSPALLRAALEALDPDDDRLAAWCQLRALVASARPDDLLTVTPAR
jgi:hypothetical protein